MLSMSSLKLKGIDHLWEVILQILVILYPSLQFIVPDISQYTHVSTYIIFFLADLALYGAINSFSGCAGFNLILK